MLEHSIAPTTGVAGYEIANSLRFNDNDSAYLSRTPSSAGNRKTWTYSCWIKVGNLSTQRSFLSTTGSQYTDLRVNSDNQVEFYIDDGSAYRFYTSQLFRDSSAWYHIVVVFDTTQATASNRAKLYVNGEQVTAFDIASYPAQNYDGTINNNIAHTIGRREQSASQYFDGYLAEVNFIDGQALDPSNFGETGDYGEWKPIKYTGAYGVNGFYLDFENSGSLGADVSGNGNNWTPTNLAATDQMLDSPTNNFATFNPLDQFEDEIFTEGNTFKREGDTKTTFTIGKTTMVIPSSGKWYAEFCHTDQRTTDPTHVYFGITSDDMASSGTSPHSSTYGINKGTANTQSYKSSIGSQLTSDVWTSYVGDVYQIAVDMDAMKIWAGHNNTWVESGNPSAGTNELWSISSAYAPYVFTAGNQTEDSGRWQEVACNFGQDSSFAGNKTAQGNADGNGIGDFYYTPPTGYLALCTHNLSDPTVIPSEHFNTVLYTGDSVSSASGGQAITGVGFQPDLNWIKSRSGTFWHMLHDAVRGAGANKRLSSNSTSAEPSNGENHLMSFDTDGFTVGHDDSGSTNLSGGSYVSWCWKANGAGVSNTNGTITSTVSANVDAGFSIVSYTGNGTSGATVGHGLSSAPDMMIVKRRNVATDWLVYHSENTVAPETEILYLNLTNATYDYQATWNDTKPTQSLFTLGNAGYVNESSDTYIAYCFHSVDGYSKVGSYTGNGSSDGTFVYTGFRPAYVMIKRSDGTSNWELYDTARNSYNGSDLKLYPNLSAAEGADAGGDGIDHLSNGFKLRSTTGGINVNTGAFIYLAFSEQPFKHTNAR